MTDHHTLAAQSERERIIGVIERHVATTRERWMEVMIGDEPQRVKMYWHGWMNGLKDVLEEISTGHDEHPTSESEHAP